MASSLSSVFTSMVGIKFGKEAGRELGLYVVVVVDDDVAELGKEVWRILKSLTSSEEEANMWDKGTPLLKGLPDVLGGFKEVPTLIPLRITPLGP